MGTVVELKAQDEPASGGLVDRWKLLQKIIADPTLKRADVAVAGLLLDMCGCKGRAWPSAATIAERTNQTPRNVSRCLERLGKYFRVTKSPGPGRPQTYRPIFLAEGATPVSTLSTKRVDTHVREGATSVSKRVDTHVYLISEEEPVEENQGRKSSLRSPRAREGQGDLFQTTVEAEEPSLENTQTAPASQTPPSKPKEVEVARARKATLETYIPDEAMEAWQAENAPGTGQTHELVEEWRDYHRAKGSKIKDCAASFRNWLRNEVKFEARGNSGRSPLSATARKPSVLYETIAYRRAGRGEPTSELEIIRRARAMRGENVEPPIIDHEPAPDPDFDLFWRFCPKQTDKDLARAAFAWTCRETPAREIIDGMKRYWWHCNQSVEDNYRLAPHVWLERKRWTDRPPAPAHIPDHAFPGWAPNV